MDIYKIEYTHNHDRRRPEREQFVAVPDNVNVERAVELVRKHSGAELIKVTHCSLVGRVAVVDPKIMVAESGRVTAATAKSSAELQHATE